MGWNGEYRDTVRDFWRGEPAALGEFALRFTVWVPETLYTAADLALRG